MNSWLKDIDRATTEAEVVSRTRDYCSLVSPRDLQPLPEECREIRIESQGDIPLLRERLAIGFESACAHASELEKLLAGPLAPARVLCGVGNDFDSLGIMPDDR